MDACQLLKEQIAEYFPTTPHSVFLFWKGRVALYAILKAIGIKEGDEIKADSYFLWGCSFSNHIHGISI